jgi:hypothetical protein
MAEAANSVAASPAARPLGESDENSPHAATTGTDGREGQGDGTRAAAQANGVHSEVPSASELVEAIGELSSLRVPQATLDDDSDYELDEYEQLDLGDFLQNNLRGTLQTEASSPSRAHRGSLGMLERVNVLDLPADAADGAASAGQAAAA